MRRNPIGPKSVMEPVADLDLTEEEMEEIPVAEGGGSLEYIPAAIALQIFANTSAVVGALVGFALAYKMRNVRAMSTAETLFASGVIVAATFGSVFFIRSFK